MRVFTEEGGLVYGQPIGDSFLITTIAPGQSSPPILFNTATTAGVPMGTGHYFVEVMGSLGTPSAVGCLTVGSPPNPAPSILVRQSDGTSIYEPQWLSPSLRVSNATSTPLTLTNLYWSATTPAWTTTLASGLFTPTIVTLPAGQSLDFPWPAVGLSPAGETRELHTGWFEPGLGAFFRTNEIGPPQPPASRAAELYLPRGHTVPTNGALPVMVESLADTLPGGVVLSPGQAAFALFFSLSPGAIPLPGGAVLPLAPDALMLAAIAGGLSPWVIGSPGATLPGFQTSSALPRRGTLGVATLIHPGPAVSGGIVHVAGVAFSPYFPPGNVWQSSPLRTIRLQ